MQLPFYIQRLNGVEPSHMPPEGIALSTELQTHQAVPEKFTVSVNSLNYPSINPGKSKVLYLRCPLYVTVK